MSQCIYISGPMTGYPAFNYPAFNKLAKELRVAGHEVINPAENFGGEDGRPRVDYMRLDIAHVLSATHVMVLPGWESSRGASLEVEIGRELGLPIIDTWWSPVPRESEPNWRPAMEIVGTLETRVTEFETAGRSQQAMRGEVRITDPVTGGQKGAKLAELGAIDPLALHRLAEVAGYGGKKYARGNFMKGYRWSLSYDAMQRHLGAFWGGEETDAESSLAHLAHAMWHCAALISFSERGLGTDDRYDPYKPF